MGRLQLLRKIIAFLRSLNLDPQKVRELIREAMSLFAGGFSIDKLMDFLMKLWDLVPPPGTVGAMSTGEAIDNLSDIIGAAAELPPGK